MSTPSPECIDPDIEPELWIATALENYYESFCEQEAASDERLDLFERLYGIATLATQKLQAAIETDQVFAQHFLGSRTKLPIIFDHDCQIGKSNWHKAASIGLGNEISISGASNENAAEAHAIVRGVYHILRHHQSLAGVTIEATEASAEKIQEALDANPRPSDAIMAEIVKLEPINKENRGKWATAIRDFLLEYPEGTPPRDLVVSASQSKIHNKANIQKQKYQNEINKLEKEIELQIPDEDAHLGISTEAIRKMDEAHRKRIKELKKKKSLRTPTDKEFLAGIKAYSQSVLAKLPKEDTKKQDK